MKKLILTVLIVIIGGSAFAQQHYPLEWKLYTTESYVSYIAFDVNRDKIAEKEFLQQLVRQTRLGLAESISSTINKESTMRAISNNGYDEVYYTDDTKLTTNVDLKLVEVKQYYDALTKEGYAIAYCNKQEVCEFYENQILSVLSSINNSITTAEGLESTGFKSKAKTELEKALPKFSKTEESFFWINLFHSKNSPILKQQQNNLQQTIKQKIADLELGTTICVVCNSVLFGKSYNKLSNEVKSQIATIGCNFTDEPEHADWLVTINISAREGSSVEMGAITNYFSYVDVSLGITKQATNQVVYEDEFSRKGGDTRSFYEAALSVCKPLGNELSPIIKQNIKQ